MRATIKLELFTTHGRYATYYNDESGPVPWVAEIIGLHNVYGFERQFIKPVTDYSQSCGIAARGINRYYFIPDGIYEVNERTSWKHSRRYFIKVVDTKIEEINREEVIKCLTKNS